MDDPPDLGEPQGGGRFEAFVVIGCIVIAAIFYAAARWFWPWLFG